MLITALCITGIQWIQEAMVVKMYALIGWHVPTDAEWTTLTDYLTSMDMVWGKWKPTLLIYGSQILDGVHQHSRRCW